MFILKKLVGIFLIVTTSTCFAQPTLEKLWETDTILARAECVLADRNILYVSLQYGEPLVVDGIGAIAKLRRDGSVVDTSWVTGLNAPKGMAFYNKRLYVTDITKVIAINPLTGKIEKTIPVIGSAGLNDLEIDAKGTLYVSDPELGYVYRILNDKPEIYLRNIKSANGLKVVNGSLYILMDTALLKVLPGKKLISLTKMDSGGDGVQPIGNGDFLLSRYQGVIQYLHKNGILQTLLDTQGQQKSQADFDYDPVRRILYVPTLTTNSVVAYRLKVGK